MPRQGDETPDARATSDAEPSWWYRHKWAMAAAVVVAVVGGLVFTVLGTVLLLSLTGPDEKLSDLIKIALTVSAGIGGAVALVVAYRKQRGAERDERRNRAGDIRDHERFLNERFGAAAQLLGHAEASTRLAGVYAMAALADDWPGQQQQCIDVLCAYLRLPYDPATARPGEQQVRLTIIRIIRDHLRDGAAGWQGRDLIFTDALLDGGDFAGANFSDGEVDFRGATFAGGTTTFFGARFSGGTVKFDGAVFAAGTVDFATAVFSGGLVSFLDATFSGGKVNFVASSLSAGKIDFEDALFTGGTVDFSAAVISDGTVDFRAAEVSGGTIAFDDATFAGGTINFRDTTLSRGTVDFLDATFGGSTVDFRGAAFDGGTVELAGDPRTDFTGLIGIDLDNPPRGVTLTKRPAAS